VVDDVAAPGRSGDSGCGSAASGARGLGRRAPVGEASARATRVEQYGGAEPRTETVTEGMRSRIWRVKVANLPGHSGHGFGRLVRQVWFNLTARVLDVAVRAVVIFRQKTTPPGGVGDRGRGR